MILSSSLILLRLDGDGSLFRGSVLKKLSVTRASHHIR
jgi:hypothetical protein